MPKLNFKHHQATPWHHIEKYIDTFEAHVDGFRRPVRRECTARCTNTVIPVYVKSKIGKHARLS